MGILGTKSEVSNSPEISPLEMKEAFFSFSSSSCSQTPEKSHLKIEGRSETTCPSPPSPPQITTISTTQKKQKYTVASQPWPGPYKEPTHDAAAGIGGTWDLSPSAKAQLYLPDLPETKLTQLSSGTEHELTLSGRPAPAQPVSPAPIWAHLHRAQITTCRIFSFPNQGQSCLQHSRPFWSWQ